MPNHVLNVITASDEVLDALITDGIVRFNNIIPMPDELYKDIWIHSIAEDYALAVIHNEKPPEGLNDSHMEQAKEFIENHKKYGYLHAMDFARRRWGVKWNAYDTIRQGNKVMFLTPWQSPIPVLLALSRHFPNECIQYLAANEDRGYNCFSGYLENGRAIVNDLDTLIGVGSRDFAEHLWKDFYDAQEEQIGID